MTKELTVAELQAELKKIAKKMPEVIISGMNKALLNVEGQAKADCPVRTGTLRRSIISKVVTEGENIKGVVGSNVTYALFVHDGTSKMPPRPFILNAIRQKEGDTRRYLSEAILEELKKHVS